MKPVVTLTKSGISTFLTSTDRGACDELRTLLKNQCRRVGPVFAPMSGTFAFYVYRRLEFVCELIGKHGGFMVETSDCPT
jgi:uncharacterized protein YaaQ